MKNSLFVESARRLGWGQAARLKTANVPARFARLQNTLAHRLLQSFFKNLWRLVSRTFKMSPNFIVEPLPIGKSRFLRGFLPRNLQLASHFLAGELKVRLREAQSSATMVKLLYHCAEQPIFCFARLGGQPPNFKKESDNFSALFLIDILKRREGAVCPKAITTQFL